ncbi:hypothetical protein FKM82_022228, partial [Ascaphus truei]
DAASNIVRMGIDHQKLKTMNLLLLSLVTSLVILGFIYLNELSRRIQLQQEIVMLERQSQQLVDERSVIQHKKTKELEKQTNEINKMQSTHEFQIQQQSTNFWTEKNNLLQTISSKDKIIQDQK